MRLNAVCVCVPSMCCSCCLLLSAAAAVCTGELYDLLDMYEHEAAQAKLYSMKPHELYMHLALQGEWQGDCCSGSCCCYYAQQVL